MSQRVYAYERFGSEQASLGDISWAVTRWRMAERFGWPLDYLDTIPYGELMIFFGMNDASDKLKPKNRTR